MMLRAVVTEETYGVCARVPEEEFRSEEIATGIAIVNRLQAMGRDAELLMDGPVSVKVFLGDGAADQHFEEAAADLMMAASW